MYNIFDENICIFFIYAYDSSNEGVLLLKQIFEEIYSMRDQGSVI